MHIMPWPLNSAFIVENNEVVRMESIIETVNGTHVVQTYADGCQQINAFFDMESVTLFPSEEAALAYIEARRKEVADLATTAP